MGTFTEGARELFTRQAALTKENTIHGPNQQYLLTLVKMPLPEGLEGIEEENVLDYFIANKDNINGEIDTLFTRNGKDSKEAFIREMIQKIEKKKASVVPSSNIAQQAAPIATPVAAPVAQVRKDSRGKKRLQTEIRSELFRIIGANENASASIYNAAVKHFDKNLKDVVNMVATVAGIDDMEGKKALIGFTIQCVFGKIFGAIPGTENVAKPIIASSSLLIYRYEQILFFKDGHTSSDEAVKAAFEKKVINAAAVKISEALEEPLEDIVAELLPIFKENLEGIKKEFLAE